MSFEFSDFEGMLVAVGGVCAEISSYLPSLVNSNPKPRIKRGVRTTSTFKLTRSVNLDVRRAVRDFVVGSGTKPTVQTLVRGHWKMQPCGAKLTDRKLIHVEPFWRGPEDAPVAAQPNTTPTQQEARGSACNAIAIGRSRASAPHEEHERRIMETTSKFKIVCSFTAAIREEAKIGTFVSWCPELDLYSQGMTIEEAVKALKETVSFWIKHCYEQGILDDSLLKRGWSVSNTQPGQSIVVDGLELKKYAHTRSLDINVLVRSHVWNNDV